MKSPGITITCLLLLVSSGCRHTTTDCRGLINQINAEFSEGNLKRVKHLADSLKVICVDDRQLFNKADSFSQIAERVEIDFQLTENIIDKQLKDRIGAFTPEEKAEWERKNWLEWKMLDGEKRYFNRAAPNLVLIRSFNLHRAERDSLEAGDQESIYRREHTRSIIEASENKTEPVVPVNLTINYNITVKPDAVPDGEFVRCWLPFPGESHSRQQNVRLLSASHEDFIAAPDTSVHRTIYMEARAEKGLPVNFNVSYSYEVSGQFFNPDKMKIIPYDKSSLLYKKYTSEQLPHICFTGNIKHLADSIAGSEENPYEIVRKIYYWFSNNIPWAGAQEYSIIPNIPEYVLQNRRGDCGMQTFLLISMLRYRGIPVRWQSGWMVPPTGKNLHDWCEVYYEGTGWVPLDVSYGLQYSADLRTKEFYITGIDSYRLIINDGVAGQLYPGKKFLRSEPYDFQRGEVEWRGGNLYFDKWDYKMEIIYNK